MISRWYCSAENHLFVFVTLTNSECSAIVMSPIEERFAKSICGKTACRAAAVKGAGAEDGLWLKTDPAAGNNIRVAVAQNVRRAISHFYNSLM